MISLNFIFTNTDHRLIRKFKETTKVIFPKIFQIKECLLSSPWPFILNKAEVDSIRFISMGKELEDGRSLLSYPFLGRSLPMPVHVQVILFKTPRLDPRCCESCYII